MLPMERLESLWAKAFFDKKSQCVWNDECCYLEVDKGHAQPQTRY